MDALEAEAISVLREVAATARNPVLLYSIGKDSSALLRLSQLAFHPAPVPFPLLHIDTGWKFREMISFRDETARRLGLRLLVHTNEEGRAAGVTPFTHGSSRYTDIMKTQALRQALDLHGFDVAIGGARRDEERSRAKERIFSVRAPGHRWDPRAQRPEPFHLFNTRLPQGHTLRAFPLSNWTEGDVWRFLAREQVPVVPLYFSRPRPVVRRGGQLLVVDDDRFPLTPGEAPELLPVRFRTLGCYPLTAAIQSTADTMEAVLAETLGARHSERQGRLIDHDGAGSMEQKKHEGYF